MATYYFDNNGATAGFGALTATWASGNPLWTTSSAGTATPAAVNFTDQDTAQIGFSGTGATVGTITVSGTHTINRLVNVVTGQIINSGTLVLAGAEPTIDATGSFTLRSALSGTAGFTKVGAGTLTYTGSGSSLTTSGSTAVTVAAGSLTMDSPTQLAQVTKYVVNAGANITAKYQTSMAVPAGVSYSGSGYINFYRYVTSSATLTYPAGALVGLTGTTSPAGTGSASTPTAGLWLMADSGGSYSGTSYVVVEDLPSRVAISGATSASGASAYLRYVGTGGTYPTELDFIWRGGASSNFTPELYNNSTDTPLTLQGGITRWGVSQALTMNLRGSSAYDGTIAGSINQNALGALTIAKLDACRWILTGDNTFTGGVTVSAGVLAARHANALGAAATGVVTVANNATLEVGGNVTISKTAGISITGAGTAAAGALRCTDGNNTLTGALTLTGDATVRIDTDAVLTLAGGVNYAGFTLTKVGDGQLRIPSTFTAATSGTTAVNSGAVLLTSGEGTTIPGAITVAAGATLVAKDDGSHYRGVISGALTMQADSKLTFGPPV